MEQLLWCSAKREACFEHVVDGVCDPVDEVKKAANSVVVPGTYVRMIILSVVPYSVVYRTLSPGLPAGSVVAAGAALHETQQLPIAVDGVEPLLSTTLEVPACETGVAVRNRIFRGCVGSSRPTAKIRSGLNAVPFWGQSTCILTGLSSQRDCGPKRVKPILLVFLGSHV